MGRIGRPRRKIDRRMKERLAVIFAQKGAAGLISLQRKQCRPASRSPAISDAGVVGA